MTIQKEQISARIEYLVNLINEAIIMAPFEPEIFDTCVSSIECLRNSQNPVKPDDANLTNYLLRTEKYVLNTFLKHLKNASDPNFEWNPPVIEVLHDKSLEESLSDVIQNYKLLIVEKNKDHQRFLNELENKLFQKKHNRRKILQKIHTLREKIEKQPTTLIDNADIKALQTELRKRKPKVAKIAEIPIDDITVALNKEIRAQRDYFSKLCAETYNHIKNGPVGEPAFFSNFQIQPLIQKIEAKKIEAHALMAHQEQQIILLMQQCEYQTLIEELTSTNEKLEKLNHELQLLADDLVSRSKLIAPKSTNCEELQLYEAQARETLRTQLEDFLCNLSVIKLEDKKDPDSHFFSEKLVKFIKELVENLHDKQMPTNKSVVDDLRLTLLKHLGKNPSFFRWKAPQNTVEGIQVEYFILNLFASPLSGLNAQTLKEQIAFIYHVTAKIEAFPVKTIKDYDTYKHADEEQNKIISEADKLATTISKKAEQFSEKLALFPDSMANHRSVKYGRTYQNQLHNWQNQLIKSQVNYAAQKKAALTIISPLRRLREVTSIQQNNVESLQKLSNLLNDPWIENSLSSLEAFYLEEKTRLITTLNAPREDTRAAVLLTEEDPVLVEEILKDSDKAYNKLLEETPKLDKVEAEVLKIQDALKENFRNAILKLEAQKKRLLQDTSKTLHNYAPPGFNPINPLVSQLKTYQKNALLKFNDVTLSLLTLPNTKGLALGAWSETFDNNLAEVNSEIAKRNTTLVKAREVERRLQTKEYLTSVTVITTLRNEIERILSRYIDDALKNSPDEQENLTYVKNSLLTDIDTGNFNFQNVTEALLNKVDPRLCKLLSMYMQFQTINSRYINEDTTLLNDQNYYYKLLDNVNIHLHNKNMEKISDGIHSSFFQWIRIHIFKPLQTAKLNVKNHVNRFFDTTYEPNPCVIPTLFASKTERELVALGNDAVENLIASKNMALGAA
ncbi:MAG: hypothetical protein Q8M03_04880 [Legionella sp.]|nr:hypothetical protein [Legionella sp.]